MRIISCLGVVLLCVVVIRPGNTLANEKPGGVVVHEWGTFTSLQDEQGRAIGGINTDDEPVPGFVHEARQGLLNQATELAPVYVYSKGLATAQSLMSVTMRLETPVIYFHVPPRSPTIEMNVHVAFRGGWLSQFYPDAQAESPGLGDEDSPIMTLTGKTVGQLTWAKLNVGVESKGPKTEAHVWVAPRKVEAAQVRTAAGESERFLFYRGVGHLDSPLRITRSAPAGTHEGALLQLHSQLDAGMRGRGLALRNLWLVDIQGDRRCAYRELAPVRLSADEKAETMLDTTRADFETSEYAASNLGKLRASMKAALLGEGLFSDEADGLLNTWEASYFKSAGQRVFFLVPSAWTDHVLPLEVTPASEIKRIMVGRIELVSPVQRRLLATIASSPKIPNAYWLYTAWEKMPLEITKPSARVEWGDSGVTVLAKDIPAEYRAYVALGRFRNALVLDAAAQQPFGGLAKFVKSYQLAAYSETERR